VRVVSKLSEVLELFFGCEEVMGEALGPVIQEGFFDEFFELKFSCECREGMLCHNKFSLWQIPNLRESQ
jgi:hypothetical protein